MRILESDRLLLMPVEEEDIYKLLDLRWDKEVMSLALHEPISKNDQLLWYRSLTKKDLVLSVFWKELDKRTLIGTTGLFNINMKHQRANWRMRLSLDHQGKGIGKEAGMMLFLYAFNTLNLQRIDADQFRENTAAVKFARSLGFQEEGLLRRYYYHNGVFKDVSIIGLLKEDFFRAIEKLNIKEKSTNEN
jgi:RimJ/RimL family protein N-acetyltransferase